MAGFPEVLFLYRWLERLYVLKQISSFMSICIGASDHL